MSGLEAFVICFVAMCVTAVAMEALKRRKPQ